MTNKPNLPSLSGLTGVKKTPTPSTKTKAPPATSSDIIREKKDGQQTRRFTVYVPLELAKAIQVHCAINDSSYTDYFIEALELKAQNDGLDY